MASAVEGRHLLEGNLCNKSLGLVLLRECESESAHGGEGGCGAEANLFRPLLKERVKSDLI